MKSVVIKNMKTGEVLIKIRELKDGTLEKITSSSIGSDVRVIVIDDKGDKIIWKEG